MCAVASLFYMDRISFFLSNSGVPCFDVNAKYKQQAPIRNLAILFNYDR